MTGGAPIEAAMLALVPPRCSSSSCSQRSPSTPRPSVPRRAAAAAGRGRGAVTFGLDEARSQTGEFVLDPERAEEAVRRALAARSSAVIDRAAVAVDSDPEEGTVTVTLRSSAHLVFSPALPGAPHDVDVVARATADVYVGD